MTPAGPPRPPAGGDQSRPTRPATSWRSPSGFVRAWTTTKQATHNVGDSYIPRQVYSRTFSTYSE